MSSESTFENVSSFFSFSVPYITLTATLPIEGMGLPLHAYNMVIIPDVYGEKTFFYYVCTVFFTDFL